MAFKRSKARTSEDQYVVHRQNSQNQAKALVHVPNVTCSWRIGVGSGCAVELGGTGTMLASERGLWDNRLNDIQAEEWWEVSNEKEGDLRQGHSHAVNHELY